MGHNYYYLVSSLPYLEFEKEISVSAGDFIFECEKWLGGRDLEILHGVNIDSIGLDVKDSFVVKEWKEFNKGLKEDLAGVRRSKKSLVGEKVSSAYPAGSVSRYREIFEENTPLLMEKKMERIRWDFIEWYESWYDFDINRLVLYLLKLQILERLAGFNKEKGEKIFDRLCGGKIWLKKQDVLFL